MSRAARGTGGSGPFVFISTMDGDPWGGSEELWWASALRLRADGARVRASVVGWSPPHEKVQALSRAGVDVDLRPRQYPLAARGLQRLLRRSSTLQARRIERWLRRERPGLVIVNHGLGLPPPDILRMLAANGYPFLTVTHAASEFWWPDDGEAAAGLSAVSAALCCCFVSEANRQVIHRQYGVPLARTAVVRNPYDADHDERAPWPATEAADHLSMACVGRLDPNSKGQDLLLEVLAGPAWRARNWTLNLYGGGRSQGIIARLMRDFGVEDRVQLRGHNSVRDIWAENHVLVLPSRAEGLPIVIVEAMLYGRPVVTTNVGGNVELLEDGVSGFIAGAPTVENVAEALERLWAARGELRRMGEAAAEAARRQAPRDPAGEFVAQLRRWAEAAPGRQPDLGRPIPAAAPLAKASRT